VSAGKERVIGEDQSFYAAAVVVSEMLFGLIEFYTLLKESLAGQRFYVRILYLKENRMNPPAECSLLMRKVIGRGFMGMQGELPSAGQAICIHLNFRVGKFVSPALKTSVPVATALPLNCGVNSGKAHQSEIFKHLFTPSNLQLQKFN
jgi:hypothetical protein